MTAALEGGEWSAARPGHNLPPGKTRHPLYRRLGRPQGRSGRAENLAPLGFDPRAVQPVVSRHTDWTTRPTPMIGHVKNHKLELLLGCDKITMEREVGGGQSEGRKKVQPTATTFIRWNPSEERPKLAPLQAYRQDSLRQTPNGLQQPVRESIRMSNRSPYSASWKLTKTEKGAYQHCSF
jgi:hypothetical protein